MPIEGPEDPEAQRVPALWRGKEINLDRGSLKYSLDAAQAQADGARGAHYMPDDPGAIPFLEGVVEGLQWFVSSADDVIKTCGQEIDRLKSKRAALHGKAAAASYDQAISKLETEMGRHVRIRSRLNESIRRVQRMMTHCRDTQRHPRIRSKPSDW